MPKPKHRIVHDTDGTKFELRARTMIGDATEFRGYVYPYYSITRKNLREALFPFGGTT